MLVARAGAVAFAVLILAVPLAAPRPAVHLPVCAAIDKSCAQPVVDGLPVEAYLMNADPAWAALGSTGATAQATAGAQAGAGGAGHTASATAGASASTAGEPDAPDNRTHDVACPAAGCPDLTVDAAVLLRDLRVRMENIAAGDCNIEESNTQAGLRRMLRFSTSSPNTGSGDVRIGDPTLHPSLFQWGVCHNHWHFTSYAEYRLWTPAGYDAWRAARAADPNATAAEAMAAHPELESQRLLGHKQGFCVIDVHRYQYTRAIGYPDCTDQGISPGWGDEYIAGLDGQFIDVTGLPAGLYVLEAEVNLDRAIAESDYGNNYAAVQLAIPPAT